MMQVNKIIFLIDDLKRVIH